MVLGTFSSAILLAINNLWSSWSMNPTVQVLVNNTLVVLKNTEVVWRPIVNTSLVILKPILYFALMVLKPFGTLGLVVLDKAFKGLVTVGFVTVHIVIGLVEGVQSFMNYTKSMGLDFANAVKSGAFVLKDFTLSLAKIIQWIGYALYQLIFGVRYLIDSCEQVGIFLHRLLFEAHKITWNDVYNISIPFLVVGSILGFFVWRISKKFTSKPVDLSKKYDDEYGIPRRSSRLARKRALLTCQDLSSFPSEKSSSHTSYL
jgi:hypothetical protein